MWRLWAFHREFGACARNCHQREKDRAWGRAYFLLPKLPWHFRREDCACTALIGAQDVQEHVRPKLWLIIAMETCPQEGEVTSDRSLKVMKIRTAAKARGFFFFVSSGIYATLGKEARRHISYTAWASVAIQVQTDLTLCGHSRLLCMVIAVRRLLRVHTEHHFQQEHKIFAISHFTSKTH